MSSEHNSEVVRRFYAEVMTGGRLDRAEEFIAPESVDHAGPPDAAPGPEGFRAAFGPFRAAFPDFACELEDVIAAGDRVVVRGTASGTHSQPFLGLEPTGRRASWGFVDVLRLEDGKIAEHWGAGDELALVEQLGGRIVPA